MKPNWILGIGPVTPTRFKEALPVARQWSDMPPPRLDLNGQVTERLVARACFGIGVIAEINSQ